MENKIIIKNKVKKNMLNKMMSYQQKDKKEMLVCLLDETCLSSNASKIRKIPQMQLNSKN